MISDNDISDLMQILGVSESEVDREDPLKRDSALYDKMLSNMSLPERQRFFMGDEKFQQQEEQRKRIEAMPGFGEAFAQGVSRDVAAIPQSAAGSLAENAIGLARVPTYIGSKLGFKPAESADIALQKAQESASRYIQESGANPYLQAMVRGVGGAVVSAAPMIGAVRWISKIPGIAGLSQPLQRAIAMGTANAMQALPNVEAKDENGKNVGLQNLLTQTALGAVAGGISGKMDLNWQNVLKNEGAAAAVKEYMKSSIKEAIGDTLASGVETGIRKGTIDIDEIISDPQFIAGAFTPLLTSGVMKRKELGSLKATADAEASLMRGFGYEAPDSAPREVEVAEGRRVVPETKAAPQEEDIGAMLRQQVEEEAKSRLFGKEAGEPEFVDVHIVNEQLVKDKNAGMAIVTRVKNSADATFREVQTDDGGRHLTASIDTGDELVRNKATHLYEPTFNEVIRPQDGSAPGDIVSDSGILAAPVQRQYMEMSLKNGFRVQRLETPDGSDAGAAGNWWRLSDKEGMSLVHPKMQDVINKRGAVLVDYDPVEVLKRMGYDWNGKESVRNKSLEITDPVSLHGYSKNKVYKSFQTEHDILRPTEGFNTERFGNESETAKRPFELKRAREESAIVKTPEPSEAAASALRDLGQISAQRMPSREEVAGDIAVPKEQITLSEPSRGKPQPEQPQEPPAPPPPPERPKSFYDQVRAERERVGGYESPTKLTDAMARKTTAARMGETLSEADSRKAATEDIKMHKVANDVIKAYGDDRSAAEAIAADIEGRKDMSGDDKRTLNAAALKVLENPDVSKDARLKKVLGDFSTKFGEEASKDMRSRIAEQDGIGKAMTLIEDAKSKSDAVQLGKKVKAKEIHEAATGKKSKLNDLVEVLRKLEYSEPDIKKVLKEEGLPDDLLDKVPVNKVREKSLSSIVKEHYVTDYNSTKPFADRLVDVWGISRNAADRMSTFVEAKYGQAAVDGAKRYVDALVGKIKSQPRAEKIREMINDALKRGVFGDEDAADALAEAIGIKGFDTDAREQYKNLIEEADKTDDVVIEAKLREDAKKIVEYYTPKDKVNWIKDWYYASMFTVPTFVKTVVSPIEIAAMKNLTGPAARLMDTALSKVSGKPRTMVRESFGKNIKGVVPTIKGIASSYADIVKGYSQINNDVVSKFISQYPETFDRINELLGVDGAVEKMLQTSSRADDIPTGSKLSDIERVIRGLKESGDPKKNIAATVLMLSRVNRGFVEAGDNAIFFQGFKDSLENQIEAFMKSQGLKLQNGTDKIPAMDIAKMGPNSVATIKDADGNAIGDRLLKQMPDMLANAVIEGKGYTYQRVTKLSEKMQDLKEAMNKVTPKWVRENALGVGDVIAPFTTIVGRFASRTLDFSPLGMAKSLYQAIKYLNGDNRYSQRLISQKFGEGLAGTVSLAVVANLVNQLGLWVPSSISKEERERLGNIGFRPGTLNLSGFKRVANTFFDVLRNPSMLKEKGIVDTLKDAAAIQKGDKGVNTDYFPILNMHLGVMKAMNDSYKETKKGEGVLETLYNIGGTALEAPIAAATELFDLPATKNIAKFMNLKYDKDAKWSDAFIEIAQGPISTIIVPSLIASAARTIDGNVKDLKPLDPFKRVLTRIPGASRMVGNKLGFTGEELSYFNKDTSWPVRAFSMFILGDFARGKGSEDNVGIELVKMARIAADSTDTRLKRDVKQGYYKVEQFEPGKEISIGKYKAELTPEQAKEVNQKFVADVYQQLDKLIASDSYQRAAPMQQIQLMKTIVQRSMFQAKNYIHKQWGKDFFKKYVERLNADRRQLLEERKALSR